MKAARPGGSRFEMSSGHSNRDHPCRAAFTTYPPLVHSKTASLAGPARLANLSDDTPHYLVESTVLLPDFACIHGPKVRCM